MRFKSQNTIITVSVSEHSVSLTRVCVSKYKILDTRRFRELLARPPAAARCRPGQLSTWRQLPQAVTAATAARPRKQRVTRGGMPSYYEHGPLHHHRQKRKQKPESLRCWEPRLEMRWELVTASIWVRSWACYWILAARWSCSPGLMTMLWCRCHHPARGPPICVVIIPTSTTCCHNPEKFCSPI